MRKRRSDRSPATGPEIVAQAQASLLGLDSPPRASERASWMRRRRRSEICGSVEEEEEEEGEEERRGRERERGGGRTGGDGRGPMWAVGSRSDGGGRGSLVRRGGIRQGRTGRRQPTVQVGPPFYLSFSFTFF